MKKIFCIVLGIFGSFMCSFGAMNFNSPSQAFPNPFEHSTTIQIEAEGNYTVVLTDLLGKQLFNKQSSGNSLLEIGEELESGIYILSVINNSEKQNIRIIKQ